MIAGPRCSLAPPLSTPKRFWETKPLLSMDYLGTDAVNARMDLLGFKQIRILRCGGGGGERKAGKEADNKRFGLGVATPREMVVLLEKLDRGETD